MSNSERRNFVRINANFVVSYYVYPGHVDRTDMTLTRNVSLGGICFTTDKHFPPQTILHITLRLPKVEKLIEALSEVMYVKQEMNKKLLFDIGLKFIQANEDDLYLIDKIIGACASSGTKLNMIYKIKKHEDKKN
ncbi:MAG: PilZ domain-containing protein [Candidatus Omnitrophica bacterium]|nr:PilZ domain-containing protein [Candidatus Omnitrophota bacterium]